MNAMSFPRKIDTPSQSASVPSEKIATYDARQLVTDGVQACVVLDGKSYFLRITRAGKLILTK